MKSILALSGIALVLSAHSALADPARPLDPHELARQLILNATQHSAAILGTVRIDAVNTMGIDRTDPYAAATPGDPPVWAEYRRILAAAGSSVELVPILKWDFYSAVASADHVLTIQTAERAPWANLLLTLGADGMVLVTKAGEVTHLPSIAREVFDVSGAGDTVTAWVGSALAAGATLVEAAQLANYAAGLEVAKAGVATITPEELLAVHEERFDQIGRLRRGGAI